MVVCGCSSFSHPKERLINHLLLAKLGPGFNTLLFLLFDTRYLVPRDMSIGQFIHILSNRLHLTQGKALFVFVKNTLPQTGECFSFHQFSSLLF